MSSYKHIHPDFHHIMLLSDKERIEFLDEPRWIGYKTAQQVMDTLQGLLHKPVRPRMPNLLLVGDPNNGKTTIVRRFFDLCGQGYVNEDADPVKPIILAEAPPSADEKSLYISILERFFTPYRATDPVSKLRYQVIHLFRACHVRMLIIDEFHSLLTGSAVKQREVMNAIKLLCNELAIPIVGVGTREAVRVLHSDPQHASRFDVMSLPVWELNPDFQRLLADFEKVLPLKNPSRLHQPELATALHAISEGNIGNLHCLLVECAKEAAKSGKEQIDKAIIESKAWVRPTRGIRELMA
ncbi:TPA: TniB family NTP-binding protein [Aeromonas veronii]|uniref:TniB family NTP-binding protein n=1 Tax=Aeromonas TaxID=642 RepID=UPI001C5B0EBE|nr:MULTISPECIES: TniB family NTP-binding protein [Aeromonas]MBW3833325.1 AAA family ATPase [Aeromonas hydrophila]MBW5263930.1 AAA family ATPase [Aeromonas hydrophila]MBW5278889.1 AAA family ATPase [Aeromonas hydrophila]UJP34303.1 TniB family NTP-binding protein [Aeromonas veronii]HEA3201575.1 TniB family NTP-binding protein [Aeromonas veronii]